MEEELGTYDYLGPTADRVEDGSVGHLTMDYLLDTNACVCGDPDRAIEMFRAYEATGCDVVFCLFNPYDVAHDDVMQTIELMGEHVIPAFKIAPAIWPLSGSVVTLRGRRCGGRPRTAR